MSNFSSGIRVELSHAVTKRFGSLFGMLEAATCRHYDPESLPSNRIHGASGLDTMRLILECEPPLDREDTAAAAYIFLGFEEGFRTWAARGGRYDHVQFRLEEQLLRFSLEEWQLFVQCCRQVASAHERRLADLGHPEPPRTWAEFVGAARVLMPSLAANSYPWEINEALRQKLLLNRSVQEDRTPVHPLIATARSVRVKGKELEAIELMVKSNCGATLADYASKLCWPNPTDNWNSVRKALNKKLRRVGWSFGTEGRKPVFKKIERRSPSNV